MTSKQANKEAEITKKEIAGLGDVGYVKSENGRIYLKNFSAPSSQDKTNGMQTADENWDWLFKQTEIPESQVSNKEKERKDKLIEDLLCTVPEGIFIPKGDGTYQKIMYTEEERDQLAKELWPFKYYKEKNNNDKGETK